MEYDNTITSIVKPPFNYLMHSVMHHRIHIHTGTEHEETLQYHRYYLPLRAVAVVPLRVQRGADTSELTVKVTKLASIVRQVRGAAEIQGGIVIVRSSSALTLYPSACAVTIAEYTQPSTRRALFYLGNFEDSLSTRLKVPKSSHQRYVNTMGRFRQVILH